MNENTADKRKAVRRTTIILVTIALAFYLGFVLMGLLRA